MLQYTEESKYQQNGLCDIKRRLSQQMPERTAQTLHHGIVRNRVNNLPVSCCQTECQYGQDRTDRAQGNQSETVLPCIASSEGLSDADAQCHDERHRNRSRRYTAGVIGHRQEGLLSDRQQQRRTGKQNHVEKQQHRRQIRLHDDPDDRKNQKQTNTDADRKDQHRRRDHRTDLPCQHRQIRFRNGNHHTHQKTGDNQDPHTLGLGQADTDIFTDR